MWVAFGAYFFALQALSLGDESGYRAHSQPSSPGPSFITSELGERWLKLLVTRDMFKTAMELDSVTSLKFSPFDPPGVIYGSNRTKVDMTLLLKSCETLNMSIIVVEFPDAPERKQQIAAAGLFVPDINVYDKVLPKMDDFLYGINHLIRRSWTKPLHLVKYSKLMLYNIEDMGYKRKNKRDGLDMEHCKVAVDDLAKFHALSVVLQSKDQLQVADFNLSLSQRNAKGIGDWYGKLFTEFAKSIRAAWGPEWESTAQLIDTRSKTITEDHQKILARDETKLNALLNGAFTINNLFFNYGCSKNESSPKSSKVLNFQNAFWNTPAIDLQVFLNTSPEPEIMTDDSLRDEIVTFYAKELIAFLKMYGYEGTVTVEDIKSEVLRTEMLGFLTAVNSLSGMYLRPEDSSYTEKFIIDALKNKEIRIDSKGMILPRYIEVMKKLVKRAQNLGVL